MATMLNGAAVMDAAFLLIAGNESCPQPQTSEHLAAIEIMKLRHILILQNKIDLVKETQAKDQYDQIVKFVQGTVAEGAPIIPISAQLKYNIEVRLRRLFNFHEFLQKKKLQSVAGLVRIHNEEDSDPTTQFHCSTTTNCHSFI